MAPLRLLLAHLWLYSAHLRLYPCLYSAHLCLPLTSLPGLFLASYLSSYMVSSFLICPLSHLSSFSSFLLPGCSSFHSSFSSFSFLFLVLFFIGPLSLLSSSLAAFISNLLFLLFPLTCPLPHSSSFSPSSYLAFPIVYSPTSFLLHHLSSFSPFLLPVFLFPYPSSFLFILFTFPLVFLFLFLFFLHLASSSFHLISSFPSFSYLLSLLFPLPLPHFLTSSSFTWRLLLITL